jgi:hypothetical protein
MVRTQLWHYPSRQQCLDCHTAAAGWALGFNTAQLNLTSNAGGNANGPLENQLSQLARMGYFTTNLTGLYTLRALAALTDTVWSVEFRVRSYLAANCAGCHQPGTSGPPGQATWDARISTPLSLTGLINGIPASPGALPDDRLVKPGDPDHSILLTRLSSPGVGHLTPLGNSMVDTQAVQLVSQWVSQNLLGYLSFADWQLKYFGSTNAPQAAPTADPDGDGAPNYLEYLVGTNPLLATDAWRISYQATNGNFSVRYPAVANRGFEVQFTSRFDGAASWQPLDVPGNQPFISANPYQALVQDGPLANSARFYRVRVFEP